jgi:hypothetical protein
MKKLFAVLLAYFAISILFIVGNVRAAQVPDTGQTKCYNNSTEIPCPGPGEPFYGQDAQYDGPARSYTKLGDNRVKDDVTGLIWEADLPGHP